MRIWNNETKTFVKELETGTQYRIEGSSKEVNMLLNKTAYKTVTEGFEADGVKTVYIEVIKLTLAKLITMFKKELKANNVTTEQLEEYDITELCPNTSDIAYNNYNDFVTIYDSEWDNMNSVYNDYGTKLETQQGLLFEIIDNRLAGGKMTVSQAKKNLIKRIED